VREVVFDGADRGQGLVDPVHLGQRPTPGCVEQRQLGGGEPIGPDQGVLGAAELLARMVDRLRELNGAGLAAPQVGASVKVIVIEVRKTDVFPDRPTSPLLQMINPVIDQSSYYGTVWDD
jgi:hypothetical protein